MMTVQLNSETMTSTKMVILPSVVARSKANWSAEIPACFQIHGPILTGDDVRVILNAYVVPRLQRQLAAGFRRARALTQVPCSSCRQRDVMCGLQNNLTT